MEKPLILPFRGVWPQIDPTAFIAPRAVVIGDVVIGPYSSVWPCCVLRGDVGPIRVGARTNIQDGSVLHVSPDGKGTHLGNDVTIGHMALLHDCEIEDSGFVGMRATLLDGAKIEKRGMLAANALLTSGKTIKSREMWAGSPAKFFRQIGDEESELLHHRAAEYVALAEQYGS